MSWLLPAALAGLVLLAGPLALHLLTRHRARQIPFPSVRFVRPSTTAAVRLRRPSDVWLLMLRLAAVASAVAACAQPLVVTRWRLAGWNARVARAIVIDASPSMRRADAAGRLPADLAVEIGRAEESGAVRSTQIVASDLQDGLTRATRLLDTMPPARREIVVVSDFQQGSIDSSIVAAVPADIGIRFVRAGSTAPARREWTGPMVDGWRGDRWQGTYAIDTAATSTSWRRMSGAAAIPGLSLVAPAAEESDARSALRAAMAFGVPATPLPTPVVIAFDGATLPASFATAREPRSRSAARLILSLRSNRLLREAGRSGSDTRGLELSAPWQEVLRDPHGGLVVAAAEADGQVVIRTSAAAKSTLGAAIVRSLLVSAVDSRVPDEEVIQISDAQLEALRREPGPVTRQAWPRVDRTDARWFWGAALLLLLIEGRVRGSATARPREDVDVRAA